jgi:hypothetical protein
VKSSLALIALVACGPAAPPPATGPQAEYPGVLHPPSELHPDFSVQQHIQATSHGKSGSFDAVLQKQGNKLVVVGLGPASVRMFVLEQTDKGITFEQSFGPTLPFPPRNIVVDVHRAFFKGLPIDPQGGTRTGTVDDEEVREIWQGENLVERRFTRADHQDPITVTYGPGCTRARCAPKRITLDNPWFSYKLVLDNDSYEFFSEPESKP